MMMVMIDDDDANDDEDNSDDFDNANDNEDKIDDDDDDGHDDDDKQVYNHKPSIVRIYWWPKPFFHFPVTILKYCRRYCLSSSK